MTKRATALVMAVAAGAATLTAGVAGSAMAGGRAATTVTIQAEGTDLSGTVRSARPAICADERTVIVFRQRGTRGGGNDERFAMDTSEQQGDDYVWSTGNTGTAGRFYAKVRRTAQCQADTSPTIRAVRNN